MVLKCFNLPSSPPPTRGSGKERIQVKWTCLEMVLWRKSCLHCQEISSSVHWPAAAAPLENTSWMHQQSSSVVSGEQQRWPGLAGVARPQPQYKSAERTRSSQLCLSVKWKYARLLSPVYILASVGVVSPRVWPQYESLYQLTWLLIDPGHGIRKKPSEHHTFSGVSLYGVLTNGAQWYMWGKPIHVLLQRILHHVSFRMFL